MRFLTILLLIAAVMAVLAAGKFKHPPIKEITHNAAMSKWPLPETHGALVVLGEDEITETENVLIPDLWFYRRKDKAFQEAHKWLEEGGKVWWRPFQPAVNGQIKGDEYVEVHREGGIKSEIRRLIYIESTQITHDICTLAGFTFENTDKGWRCYGKNLI